MGDSASQFLVVLVIILVVQAFVFAALASWVAEQKGYNPTSWLVLGFLFGVVALLAIGLAPNARVANDIADIRRMVGEWYFAYLDIESEGDEDSEDEDTELELPPTTIRPFAFPPSITLEHFGEVLALGRGRGPDGDYFGIWDGRDGELSGRFPMTDEGWEEAWEAFSAAEPTSVARDTPPPGFPRAGL